MSKLREIQETLANPKQCKTYFLRIYDMETGHKIDEKTRAEINQMGGLKAYLKHLRDTHNVNRVEIDPRRSNGSRDIRRGQAVTVELGQKSNTPKTTTPKTTTPKTTTPQPQTPTPPVQFDQNPAGLGVGLNQIMEGYSAQQALRKLEAEHAELKSKFESLQSDKERLKDENVDLKRQNDRLQDKMDSKGILDGLDINQALPVLVGLIKQPQQQQGLNAPQLQGARKEIRAFIENPQTPDEIADMLYKTIANLVSNSKFYSEYINFINQYQPQKVENDG